MNLNHKRTLIVAVALSTFFAATLSYSRQKSRLNQRVMTETPQKAEETKTEAKTVSSDDDKKLVCRTGALALGTKYTEESLWASRGKSEIPLPLIKSGIEIEVDCTSAVPPLLTDADQAVTTGKIKVKCDDGLVRVTGMTCVGRTLAMIKAEQEEAARIKAEQDRLAAEEAARQAAAAEAARIAAEQAAAAAAAAAAQAAASAACPQNCGGATGSYKGGSTGKNGTQYTVTYQACNSGHKIVRSSGNTSLYAVGACYNSVPK
jgi:hypothetical protein